MKVTVCVIGTSDLEQRKPGGYEWGCQVICARALDFMQRTKDSAEFPRFYSFKNIVGLLIDDNAAAKALGEFILKHPKLSEYGMTGAMHQFGIQHAQKIFELGREEYLRQLRECREPGDFYEFEWDDAFPVEVSA